MQTTLAQFKRAIKYPGFTNDHWGSVPIDWVSDSVFLDKVPCKVHSPTPIYKFHHGNSTVDSSANIEAANLAGRKCACAGRTDT